jgi:hypothetical protein
LVLSEQHLFAAWWTPQIAAISSSDPECEYANIVGNAKKGGRPGSRIETFLIDGFKCLEYDIINPREVEVSVAFRGRTGGWVQGELNGAMNIINTITSWEWADQYKLSPEKPASCWAVMPRVGLFSNDTSQGGDFGSIVLLDDKHRAGRWVGLLFGAGVSGAGYLTPIHVVLKDIETELRATVVRLSLA